MLDLDVDATYPVCVTGSGDFSIEYWTDEDGDQESIPFEGERSLLVSPGWPR